MAASFLATLLQAIPRIVLAIWFAFLTVVTYGTARMGFPAMFDRLVVQLYSGMAVLMPWLPAAVTSITQNEIVQALVGFMMGCLDCIVDVSELHGLAVDALLVYIGCRYVCPIAGVFFRWIALRLLL